MARFEEQTLCYMLGIDHTTTTSMMRHAVLLLACVALAHAHGPILSPLPFSCSAALLQMEQGAHDNLKHLELVRSRGCAEEADVSHYRPKKALPKRLLQNPNASSTLARKEQTAIRFVICISLLQDKSMQEANISTTSMAR